MDFLRDLKEVLSVIREILSPRLRKEKRIRGDLEREREMQLAGKVRSHSSHCNFS